jgi:hypothetical protein
VPDVAGSIVVAGPEYEEDACTSGFLRKANPTAAETTNPPAVTATATLLRTTVRTTADAVLDSALVPGATGIDGTTGLEGVRGLSEMEAILLRSNIF